MFELLPLYAAAQAWQKAHKAYNESISKRRYPKGTKCPARRTPRG